MTIAHHARTFSICYSVPLDGVPYSEVVARVTLHAAGQALLAQIDGKPASLAEAVRLITTAQQRGRCELLSEERWEEEAVDFDRPATHAEVAA